MLIVTVASIIAGCGSQSPKIEDGKQRSPVINKNSFNTQKTLKVKTVSTVIRLFVNGKQASVAPVIVSGVTYVPVRAAGELLNKYVSWDASSKTVYISDQKQQQAKAADKTIKLIVNGKQASVAPKILSGVTYIPVRAAGQLLYKYVTWDSKIRSVYINDRQHDRVIYFPESRYPETAAHIKSSLARGESPICTIDRLGADENREQSLSGIPVKSGYDRDEFPMAMCMEGGAGADVAYVKSSDNRGAGSWVGNELEIYPNGMRILFIVDGKTGVASPPTSEPAPKPNPGNVYYDNCTAVIAAGAAPLYKGQPGYSSNLDRDGDGVACEK